MLVSYQRYVRRCLVWGNQRFIGTTLERRSRRSFYWRSPATKENTFSCRSRLVKWRKRASAFHRCALTLQQGAQWFRRRPRVATSKRPRPALRPSRPSRQGRHALDFDHSHCRPIRFSADESSFEAGLCGAADCERLSANHPESAPRTMSIRAAIHHLTHYRYDRPVSLGPQIIRLRPAPHSRTRVISHSLKVTPADHFVNVQQDPYGNWLARYVFPELVNELKIEVDVVADMTVYNPFDFFVEESAEIWPFEYGEDLRPDLVIYRTPEPAGPRLQAFLDGIDRSPKRTVDFVVDLNRRLASEIEYVIRMEPGVQSPEETFERASARAAIRAGSWCRSCAIWAWRRDSCPAISSSSSPISSRSTGRPAPTTTSPICTPGPRSIFRARAGSASIRPRACWPAKATFRSPRRRIIATPRRSRALASFANVEFAFDMRVDAGRRASAHHQALLRGGLESARHARRGGRRDARRRRRAPHHGRRADLRLDRRFRVGRVEHRRGRPDQADARRQADPAPARPLRARRVPALRAGQMVSGRIPAALDLLALLAARRQADLVGREADRGRGSRKPARAARRREALLGAIASELGLEPTTSRRPTRIPPTWIVKEANLPDNVTPENSKLKDPEERQRLARVFARGLTEPSGYVLPIQRWQAKADGPSLAQREMEDAARRALSRSRRQPGRLSPAARRAALCSAGVLSLYRRGRSDRAARAAAGFPARGSAPSSVASFAAAEAGQERVEQRLGDIDGAVRTAVTVEARDGRSASSCRRSSGWRTISNWSPRPRRRRAKVGLPVHIEGYPPPVDPRLNVIRVAPDPGVIEVNIHPAVELARMRGDDRGDLRGGAAYAARRRQVHDRRQACRDRRGQSCRGRRRDAARQPVPQTPRPAQEPRHPLAEASEPLVFLLRPVHRTDQPGAARRRGAPRQPVRTGDRVRPDPAARAGRRRRRRGSSTG